MHAILLIVMEFGRFIAWQSTARFVAGAGRFNEFILPHRRVGLPGGN
jgi:hypothetical protein